jgi:hypothetical protein
MSQASQAQVAANRANAQLSTGPKTPEGKAKSSFNAVKSALTGRVILLPTDDVPAYERLVQNLIAKYQPATDEEKILVQSLADTDWRLRRIPTLESGLYALGQREFEAEPDTESDPQLREAILQAKILVKFKRELSNLSIQETRLRRMRAQDLATLLKIQAERRETECEMEKIVTEKSIPASAVALYREARKAEASLDLSQIGFDFANDKLTIPITPARLKQAA